MSNRLFQGIVHQLKDSLNRVVGVIDETGTVISCSELGKISEVVSGLPSSVFTDGESVVIGGFTYRAFGSPLHLEYAVFIEGADELAAKYAEICCISMSSIKQFYDEKYDRSNFIKNIILDNILPGDIFLKARELHFNNEVSRVVLLIRITENNDATVFDIMQSLFPEKNKDFIINLNENDIVLVKEVHHNIETKDLEKLASSISESLLSQFYAKTLIGIGTTVTNIKDLARSFKEAQVSLEVGKVFDTEKTIVSYDHLGIARLIYQLPTTLCDMFLREVFKRGSIESLDAETLFTIQKFFENNLNVSETSRKLFVHRNTLVYRLEKIKKLSGLDLREFDDAIVFKVALMVKKYLDAKPTKY